MNERTRTIYFLTFCWAKNGEIFEDSPSDEDFCGKDEACARAQIAADGCKPGQWYAVWEMIQKWDEEFGGWMAGPSKIVFKTRKRRGAK